jgi:hypothetical protein
VSNMYLETRLIDVDNALAKGAIDGSHNHQKLYYQRTNKITDDKTINVNVLSVGVNLSGEKPADMKRVKGILDVNPVIPHEEEDIFDG